MASKLKVELEFDVAPGATQVIPHGLEISQGTPLVPDKIYCPDAQLSVTADDTNVTLTNNGESTSIGVLLVEEWHSIEKAFGVQGQQGLPIRPYVVYGGSKESLNPMSPPEQWVVSGIEAPSSGQMSQQVSANFIEIQTIRPGSIVGVRARSVNTVVAGTVTCIPTINGTPVAGLAATIGAGSTGESATAAPDAFPYVAGDRLGFVYTADASFSPVNTVEAWLEVFEQL